ncbi:hypothetical protein ACFJIX_03805 [Roseateles sp. UC29_93]
MTFYAPVCAEEDVQDETPHLDLDIDIDIAIAIDIHLDGRA